MANLSTFASKLIASRNNFLDKWAIALSEKLP
jgi:hypothetical protein